MKIYEGKLSGKGKKFTIILSRFNSFITDRLLEGAVDCLLRHEVSENDITVVKVPGAFEIPLACKKFASRDDTDAVITLGAVIRGETPHFDLVASEVAKGVAQVGLQLEKPVIFGVLTTDTIEQAESRAGGKGSNKGFDAALTALELTDLFCD